MTELIGHLESRLGRIRSGWTRDARGVELNFQVAEFRGGGQLEGSASYATLGLSTHRLEDPVSGKSVAMELVMTTHSAQAPARIPQAIQAVGQKLLHTHQALLRGQVMELPGVIADGSGKSFVYAAIPGYFDENFDIAVLADRSEIIIVWLVPISAAEAKAVEQLGWPSLERDWKALDPDLLDLFRPDVKG